MPVIRIEVTRGGRVESEHLVDAAIADDAGRLVLACGDVETPRYPRSAIKAMLALPFAETSLPPGLDDRSLALAASSHAGEPEHVDLARAMLAACGRDEADLECGTHRPLSPHAAEALVRTGAAPCPVHNNCSGKHAGLICASVALGADPAGYVAPDHPAMRAATDALATLTATPCTEANRATDGCGIPTYAIPLACLAAGFARFCTGAGQGPARRDAATRLRRAVAAHPHLLSGTGRFDTRITERLGETAFVKGGAEGVWCAGLPASGLGIALKARDGAGRAAQAAVAALVARSLGDASPPPEILRNWSGAAIGELRVHLPD